MRPFLIAESVRELRDTYPAAHRVLQAAAGGRVARSALVQLWITEGIPYAFKDCPAIYASMRTWLGQKLDVHPKEISMTGSGRFGESWVPSKLGTSFGPKSDLDLFLVSSDCFARVEADFTRWSNEYDRGEITPQNDRQAKYWDDHQRRGPKIIQRGFLDTWMIPPWHRYETVQHVAQTMWLLKRRLEATASAPVVSKAVERVYHDMTSLVDQESFNLNCATTQLEQQES